MTCYAQGWYDMEELKDKAKRVRLVAFDVDGVLTDGRLYFTDDGQELKAFNTLDGHGIKMLQAGGVQVAIITGRTTRLVPKRAADLGIEHLMQGREDKLVALRELCTQLGMDLAETAYMGDDLPDLGAIRGAGLGMTVANAHYFVRAHADWVSDLPGGGGAAREACDLILRSQGKLDGMLNEYL